MNRKHSVLILQGYFAITTRRVWFLNPFWKWAKYCSRQFALNRTSVKRPHWNTKLEVCVWISGGTRTTHLQNIPKNMLTACVYLVLEWFWYLVFDLYPPWLFHWHWGDRSFTYLSGIHSCGYPNTREAILKDMVKIVGYLTTNFSPCAYFQRQLHADTYQINRDVLLSTSGKTLKKTIY